MNDLIEISQIYEQLKRKASEKLNENSYSYLTENKNSDVKFKHYKDLEKQADKIAEQFVEKAVHFAKLTNISICNLVDKITNEILLYEKSKIDIFLLIKLIWDKRKDLNYNCLVNIERILEKLLRPEKIGYKEEYYIESLLDILYDFSEELIPINLLEATILKNQEGTYTYGAFIKAAMYLKDHPKESIDRVIKEVKKTKRFKEDEYYREWL